MWISQNLTFAYEVWYNISIGLVDLLINLYNKTNMEMNPLENSNNIIPKTVEVPLPGLLGLKVGDYIRSESTMSLLQIVRTDEKGVYTERMDKYQGQTKPQFIAWENLETDGFEKIPEMPKVPESAPEKSEADKNMIEEAKEEYARRDEINKIGKLDDLLGAVVSKHLVDSKDIPTLIKTVNSLKARAPEEIDSIKKIKVLMEAEGDITNKLVRNKAIELLLTQSMQTKMEAEKRAA